MEPLQLLVLLAVLAIVIGVGAHLLARYTWPARRQLWRRRALIVEQEAREHDLADELEKPEAGMVPDSGPVEGPRSLRERRTAGTSTEDVDH